jgi:hypothetical protein
MRAALFALLTLLAATGGACGANGRRAADIEGRYVLTGTTAAALAIVRDGDRYVVTLAGGSPANAGAAAPADCHVRAAGTVHDDILDAVFVGVETETFRYSDVQARTEARRLRLALRPNGVEVTRADTDGYCGLGATFVGVYRRSS